MSPAGWHGDTTRERAARTRPTRRALRLLVTAGAAVVVVAAAAIAEGDGASDLSTGAASSTTTTRARIVERRSSPTTLTTPASPPAAPSPAEVATPATGATTPPRPGLHVASVTDGDTVVLSDGRRVRLAQVDAPETDECFGAASTAALRTLVDGRPVSLRSTTNGPTHDRYGRTLAVLFADGRDVNEALVRDGAAEWGEQFAREDPALAAALSLAERDARDAGRGLWSACVPGSTSPQPRAAPAPAPTPQATTTTPTTAPTTTASPPAATPAPAADGDGDCHPAYPDDCIPAPPPDLDCPDIRRRVRVDHAHGDPHRFDADNDGWGCESYG